MKSAGGNVGIFFDEDADGVCSGALLAAFLKKRGLVPKLYTGNLSREQFESFSKQDLDFWIFTDFPVDQYLDWLKPLVGKCVMLVDHHPVTNDLNKSGFVYVNPRLSDPEIYYCSSHVAFDVTKRAGLRGFEWLSGIGQAGDREIDGTEDEQAAVDIIGAVTAIKGVKDMTKLAGYLSEAKNIKQFLTEPRYLKLKADFDREVEKQVALYEAGAIGGVTLFEIRSRMSITGILATKLFDLYPNRTIITYTRKKDGWNVSGRSRNLDLGAAFRKASEGIGQGGGHPVAAGAFVKDFETFKRRLLQILK